MESATNDVINAKPKVNLRAMEPEDLDLLYEIENNQNLWDVGCTNVPYSRYVLRDYIATNRQDIYADHQLRLMIDNEEGETVGIIDLANFDPRHQRAEVGIVVLKGERRRGYASAAMERLIDYATNILNLHQLYAVINSDNNACKTLFASIGFTTSAVLKEWLCQNGMFFDATVMQLFLDRNNKSSI